MAEGVSTKLVFVRWELPWRCRRPPACCPVGAVVAWLGGRRGGFPLECFGPMGSEVGLLLRVLVARLGAYGRSGCDGSGG